MTIANDGDVTVGTGNLVVGTSGKGIDFSGQTSTTATGASATSGGEVLDHYEEGTWTPTLEGTTTNPTVSNVTRYGKYTRIGNLVWISGYIFSSTWSGGAGRVHIGGLPFTFKIGSSGAFQSGLMGYSGEEGVDTVKSNPNSRNYSNVRFQSNNTGNLDVYGDNYDHWAAIMEFSITGVFMV
jgi:hypothetical protein